MALQFIIIPLVAFLTSGLTLFSGFGLGTLLLPAFLLFFPAEVSVAMTAIVHFLNNLFKLTLLGRHADRGTVLRFGVPAILASFLGANLLVILSETEPLATYSLGGRTFHVTSIKFLMGLLIALFARFEGVPSLKSHEFDRKYLPVGGVLSGFFGGLSGHQGALRSAFLVRVGMSKERFIATGVVIACMVDGTRLGVYARHFVAGGIRENVALIALATLCAFSGAFLGTRLLKKATMNVVHSVVSALLFVVAGLLCLGMV